MKGNQAIYLCLAFMAVMIITGIALIWIDSKELECEKNSHSIELKTK